MMTDDGAVFGATAVSDAAAADRKLLPVDDDIDVAGA